MNGRGTAFDPDVLAGAGGLDGDARVQALGRLLSLAARGPGALTIVTAVNRAVAPAGIEVVDVAMRSRRLAHLLRCRVAAPDEVAMARQRGRALRPGASVAGFGRSAVVPVRGRQGLVGLAVLACVEPGRRSLRHDGDVCEAVSACLSALVERRRLVDVVHRARDQLWAASAMGRVWEGAALAAADALDEADEAALARSRYELRAAERHARALSLAGAPFEGALRRLARRFQDECGVHVRLSLPGEPVLLAPATKETLLRIACEALWALQQGARSSLVSLHVQAEPGLELVVRDDGVPLARRIESPACSGPYLGLRAIRRWARAIDAEVRWAALSPRGLEFAVAAPTDTFRPRRRIYGKADMRAQSE